MPMPLNSIVQATFVWEFSGQIFLNVLHYRVAVVGTATIPIQLQDIATLLADASDPTLYAGGFLAVAPENATLHAVRAQQIQPARSAYFEIGVADGAGLLGPAPTGNDGAVIVKRTDVSGPNQHGSVRLVALPEEGGNSGNLTGVYKGLVEASMDWLTQPITVTTDESTLNPCIFHKDTANGTDITNTLVMPTVRITRRRTVGLGI